MAGLQVVTPPIHEPVDLVEMKEFLRVTGSAEDRLISRLIVEAREQFDGRYAWFNRALITQTWKLSLDHFPLYCERPEVMWMRQFSIVVPLPPLQSVGSIQYVDGDGNLQTLDPSLYVVDTQSEPGEIAPAYGTIWPVTRWQPNAVTVVFTAGYGAATKVPEEIKVWMKQVVAYRYDNRSLLTQLPPTFYWLMADYKTIWSV